MRGNLTVLVFERISVSTKHDSLILLDVREPCFSESLNLVRTNVLSRCGLSIFTAHVTLESLHLSCILWSLSKDEDGLKKMMKIQKLGRNTKNILSY